MTRELTPTAQARRGKRASRKPTIQICIVCGGRENDRYLIGETWHARTFSRISSLRCNECLAAVAMNEADGEL